MKLLMFQQCPHCLFRNSISQNYGKYIIHFCHAQPAWVPYIEETNNDARKNQS